VSRIISTQLRRVGNEKARRGVLYFPKSFVDDSTFPFPLGTKVLVRIRGQRIIIEKDTRKVRTEEVDEGKQRRQPRAAKA
jgi:hypothetical protein